MLVGEILSNSPEASSVQTSLSEYRGYKKAKQKKKSTHRKQVLCIYLPATTSLCARKSGSRHTEQISLFRVEPRDDPLGGLSETLEIRDSSISLEASISLGASVSFRVSVAFEFSVSLESLESLGTVVILGSSESLESFAVLGLSVSLGASISRRDDSGITSGGRTVLELVLENLELS